MSAYSEAVCPLDKCKADFIQILKDTRREGIGALLDFLEKKTDFFTAPYKADRDDIREGALLRHCLTVYSRLMALYSQEELLRQNKNAELDEAETRKICDSIAIIGLLHGVFMANYFRRVTSQTVDPSTGEVKDITTVEVRDNILGYGRGEESVYILSSFIKLSREEAFAIRFQDGDFSDPNTARAYRKSPLALLLHIAILQTEFLEAADEA